MIILLATILTTLSTAIVYLSKTNQSTLPDPISPTPWRVLGYLGLLTALVLCNLVFTWVTAFFTWFSLVMLCFTLIPLIPLAKPYEKNR